MPASVNIVVGRFRESLRWLESVPTHIRVFVYDMSGLNGEFQNTNIQITKIADLGHESYAYLMHLLLRYEYLSDYTIFLQGNPFDHAADCDAGQPPNFVSRLQDLIGLAESNRAQAWEPIGRLRQTNPDEPLPPMCRRFARCPQIAYSEHIGEASPGQFVSNPIAPLRNYWDWLFPNSSKPIPATLKYTWGNQWMASKALLQKKHTHLYRTMQESLRHDPRPLEAAILERIWNAILEA